MRYILLTLSICFTGRVENIITMLHDDFRNVHKLDSEKFSSNSSDLAQTCKNCKVEIQRRNEKKK